MLPQLHLSISKEFRREVTPVRNRDYFVKPFDGLWTSTYTEGTSAWVEWCRAEEFGNPDKQTWFILEPDASARIYEIDTLDDLLFLLAHYPHPDREQAIYGRFMAYLDFERISRDYDAIHLTDAGQWTTRFSEPSLNGWDCECTLWFRWCFTQVEPSTCVSSNCVVSE